MKRSLLLCLLFFPMAALASYHAEQVSAHPGKDTRVHLWIPGCIVKAGGQLLQQEAPALSSLTRYMGSIKLDVVAGHHMDSRYLAKVQRRAARYRQRNYQPILAVQQADALVQVSVKERQGVIMRLVVVVQSDAAYLHTNIKCKLTLAALMEWLQQYPLTG